MNIRFVLICGAVLALSSSAGAQEKPGGLVVITPAAFEKSLGSYLSHKRQQLDVEVLTLEEIRTTHPQADDDAERIKREIHSRWKERKIGYVLLVGGPDIMPARYRTLRTSDWSTPENLIHTMSDHYYADVAKANGDFEDWNGQREGVSRWRYGESSIVGPNPSLNADGMDYTPELAVGRWPVSNPAGAKMMADKTVRYERGLSRRDRRFGTRASFLLWDDLAPRPFVRELENRLQKAGWAVVTSDIEGPPASRPTTAAAMRFFHESNLVLDFGHGNTNGWGGLERQHLPLMKNANRLPIVMSVGCDTTPLGPGLLYDNYRTRDGAWFHTGDRANQGKPPPPPNVYQPELRRQAAPSFGHEVVGGRQTGAVAYIGFILNSNQWHALWEGLTIALTEKSDEPKRLGECWRAALIHQRKLRTGDIARNEGNFDGFYAADQGLRTLLLGDPTLLVPAP